MVFGEQSKTANQRSLQHTTIPDTVDGAEFKKRKENGGFLTYSFLYHSLQLHQLLNKTDIHIRRYVGSSALHRPVLANIWL
jgi:hypothetical protein